MPQQIIIGELSNLTRFVMEETLIAAGYYFVGFAETGLQLVDRIVYLKPDLVLLNIDLPDVSDVIAARFLQTIDRTVRIVMYGNLQDVDGFDLAKNASADGYFFDPTDDESLLRAVGNVIG